MARKRPTTSLTVQLNDQPPWHLVARQPLIHLHLWPAEDSVSLQINLSREDVDKRLVPLHPGDRLRVTYRVPSDLVPASPPIASAQATGAPPAPGRRFGLDVRFDGDAEGEPPIRLSHPPGGSFSFMLGNIPIDHARCSIHASNDHERWQWQLADLYDGDGFVLEVVETDWNTPFPSISPVPPDEAADS